jgi:hypothetical protein
LTKPAGVGDQDMAMWLNLMREGARASFERDLDLTAGENGVVMIQVKIDEQGDPYTEVTEQGRHDISFKDLAKLEKSLMQRMLRYGWEQYFGQDMSDLYPATAEALTEVEKKMEELGAFKMGIDRVEQHVVDTTADITAMIARNQMARGSDPTPNADRIGGNGGGFEDPFHTRTRSVASDSGFSGMHRNGMEMTEMLRGITGIAQDVNNTAHVSSTNGANTEVRPQYNQVLSSILTRNESANAPIRHGTGSNAIAIKSPDGTELDFSKAFASANPTPRNSSPDRKSSTFDPFTTPRRSSGSDSSRNVSPHTRTTSPKKSYTIKSSPGPARVLPPVGTPSRRGTVDNTVKIGATISEEGEEDAIMIKGRGKSVGFR